MQPDVVIPREVFSNGEGLIDDRLLELGKFNEEMSDFSKGFMEELGKAIEHYNHLMKTKN